MSETVKVTELGQTYTRQGKSYGPFKATKDTPYLEVPLAIALGAGAQTYEGADVEQAQADAGASADVEQLLKANHDLKADLDALDAKSRRTEEGLVSRVRGLEAEKRELMTEVSRLASDLDAAQARIAVLETQPALDPSAPVPAAEAVVQVAPVPVEAADGTPLPDGTPLRDLLAEHGFNTLEKLEVGLVVAEGQTESPVQQIDGIGKKTVQAYEKAIADWKAGKQ